MPEMPAFLRGISLIRGAVVPVVDVASLLDTNQNLTSTRFVTLKLGDRRIAFAVDDVIGVRRLANEASAAMPPLLRTTDAGLIDTITTLDAELILILEATYVIPDAVWEALDSMQVNQ